MERNPGRLVISKRLSVAMIAALLAASCAQTSVQEPENVPAPGESGGMEEVVVTGSKIGGSSRRQPSPAAPQGVASAAMDSAGFAYDAPARLAEPLASVQPGEEVWIIARPATDPGATADDEQEPGTGAMIVNLPDETDPRTGEARQVPLPLQHTDVKAEINGYVSTVNVVQSFANPFDEKIEAVYLFPLPEKAAVSEFVMVIGERRIRGILREKEEAEQIYQQARNQGYQASLLSQHRPNIFEQKVANIEPGKTIEIDIRYFHTLAYNDGWYSFVFPTVVGPRYNPPGSVDGIGAVANGSSPEQQTSVRYLRPEERSAHDISISVAVNAGVTIEELSSTHEIAATRSAPDTATVRLADRATIPNRDFILNFRVAGTTIKSGLLTWTDPDTQQGYFTMMAYPPQGVEGLERKSMELVFVLDCSGSMNGLPLDQAKDAVSDALDHLRADDTFQIIRFSDNSSSFGSAPVPASRSNIALARRYLGSLSGTGGTQMIEGVKAALDFPHDSARLRFVTFMTDGYIGNEKDIIAAVHERIGASRVFSFGVGSSVNRFLLERMAKEGRGAVAYLGPQDSGAKVMSDFFNRISHPALADIEFDWGSMSVSDVYPERLPDLFVGRPLVVTGKFLGAANGIQLSGYAGQERQVVTIDGSGGSDASIAKIWARLRIADLMDRKAWKADPYGELEESIRQTALAHSLVSGYTSFVAVDASQVTEGDHGVTVHQAVPVPQGVRYETTVDEN